jgi:ADP-heptose:LPS heptosyltransferase
LGTLEGVTAITTETELPPAYDYHCPLLSLALALRTEISGIPNDVPYLAATRDKVQAWKRALVQDSDPKVGIVCSGNSDHKNDHNRSIPLRQFSPLLETGASFYLLQNECRPEDEAFLSETSRIRDLRQRLTDFTETAAVIACLDLVISVDTSVAHLAGALGKPVWILLPFSPDWRWMLDREDSPWYPTARLFRQTEMGDWQGVIERVREALSRRIGFARRTLEVISLP